MRVLDFLGPGVVLEYGRVDVTSTIPSDGSTAQRPHAPSRPRAFVTTHWSVVLKAADSDSTRGRAALAVLCEAYWFPLYAHARRRGCSPQDAEDATQGLFEQLLERRSFAAADPEYGRFRSFLLTSMNHYLASEWKRERTLKRGGGRTIVSLDVESAESRYALEPAVSAGPDQAFDRSWALQTLDVVLKRLENECAAEGQADKFAALKQTLLGTRESQPYAQLAARLSISEENVKVAVHRLRKRYRELIREQIAETVDSPEAVEDELRRLKQALAGQ